MNINLGSFPKQMARDISKQFSKIKRLRNPNNKFQDFDIKFKSRSYGYGGRHRNTSIANSTKLAVYLCLKQRERLIWLNSTDFNDYTEALQFGIQSESDVVENTFKIVKVRSKWRVRLYRRA